MSYQATMNAELDKMRANGLSIDGDNAYKRDLLDAVTGALAYGKQRSAPPPAGHWLEPFYEMGKAEADERDAARSLPVGVPDGLIDELRNHAAARTGYTTDLIGRAAGAIEKILEPTAGRWAIYKEKYCGCKDASRLNRCRGLDNCELPCRHPDRNTASPAAPTVKESLSVAPTVKAEHWKCEQCGASSGEACNANGCFANERSADASPSLPAAGSAGAPLGEVEIPDIVATFDGLYLVPIKPLQAGEHLMAVAQCIRIQEQLRAALSAQQSARHPELTVWEGPMPESNGKSNFTAVLMRKGADLFDGVAGGMTIARSEYPDRVRYEADCVRWLIGELDKEPCITDYDADKHSGYVAQQSSPERSAVEAIEWLDDFVARCNGDDRGSCESVNILRRALYDRQPGGVPDFAGIVEAGEKLYNELRQWLATENDANSQEALQAWRDAYHTPATPTVKAEQVQSLPQEWWQIIHDTLRNYRMSTLGDGEGCGYPLIDAMTADGQSVAGGIEECTYLADAIWNALPTQDPSLPAAGSAEWIKHGPSKACPFSSPYTSKVDVRLRDGTERLGDLACNTMWFWYEHDPKPYDVVAYRIAALSAQHPDDAAVDRFATAMKAKLARCREKGRHGWQTASAAHLSSLLYHHMYKADPLDVANLAMMLHQNGQAIELPHEARKGGPQQSAPERVSVLSEALEDARRAMFAVLNQEPRLKSVAKRVLNAEIDRIDRALLAGAIDKS